MLTQPSTAKSVRRSIAIPYPLAKAAEELAPDETRNFNQLVIQALSEYVEKRRAEMFDEAMERMAADPDVRREYAKISEEFSVADFDGLEQEK